MIRPPLVAHVRIRTPRRAMRLWIPLLLVWIVLLPLAVPLLVIALLVTLVVAPRWRFGRAARGAYVVLCETRGTHVDVERAGTEISIALR